MKIVFLALLAFVFLQGCAERPDYSLQGVNRDGGIILLFVHENGLECASLGNAYGMNGRGFTCNWEKFNLEQSVIE